MGSWHFWQKWFVCYLCLLTDGYVNTTDYRRLSLRTGLRANWNAGSWTGWFTIDCLFPLPNNSPLIYMASTAHEMNTNIPFPTPRAFLTVVFFFSTRAQQASAATAKIHPTNTHCHTSLHPYPLIFTFRERLRLNRRELGCERATKRQTLSWLDRTYKSEETISRPADQNVNRCCSHKASVTCRQSHFAVLCR